MGKPAELEKEVIAPERVLVVEDDAILAMAIEEQLADFGVTDIVVCSTAEEALRALREKNPDAMILDVHLADRDDGWSLAELTNSIGPNPPQIIFSTGSPQDIPDRARQLGDVLEKPFGLEELGKLLLRTRKKKKMGLIGRLRGALD